MRLKTQLKFTVFNIFVVILNIPSNLILSILKILKKDFAIERAYC